MDPLMPMTRTRPAPATAAFLLTADELHVLEHRTPHLVLPPAFHTEWGSDVPPAEVREREQGAVAGLRERRLLARGDDSLPDDLTADIDPDFAAFLSMPQFATAAVDSSCWSLDRTAIQSVSVIGAHALALLRTQRVDHSDASLAEHGTAARDEDAIEIRAFDTASMMLDADVVEGVDLDARLRDWLADPAVDQVQIHTARRGCYMARAVRQET